MSAYFIIMSNNLDLSKFDDTISNFLSDKYVTVSLVIFLILYICVVSPKLQKNCSIFKVMDSNLFQMTILLLLGYVSSKNYSIGLLLMGAFFATLFTMQKHQVNDKIVSIIMLDNINTDRDGQVKNKEKEKEKENDNDNEKKEEGTVSKQVKPVNSVKLDTRPRSRQVQFKVPVSDATNDNLAPVDQTSLLNDADKIGELLSIIKEEPKSNIIIQDLGRAGTNSRDQTNSSKREQSIRGPSTSLIEMDTEEHFNVIGFDGGDFAEY